VQDSERYQARDRDHERPRDGQDSREWQCAFAAFHQRREGWRRQPLEQQIRPSVLELALGMKAWQRALLGSAQCPRLSCETPLGLARAFMRDLDRDFASQSVAAAPDRCEAAARDRSQELDARQRARDSRGPELRSRHRARSVRAAHTRRRKAPMANWAA
jgi:hypothetical protein